jgi:hypothetical protein
MERVADKAAELKGAVAVDRDKARRAALAFAAKASAVARDAAIICADLDAGRHMNGSRR